jgi:hypothetical protein
MPPPVHAAFVRPTPVAEMDADDKPASKTKHEGVKK